MSERITKRDDEGRATEMRCDCGKLIDIFRGGRDVECDCGAEYNSSGQRLADRSQWGEETGETAADYDRGFNNPDTAFDE